MFIQNICENWFGTVCFGACGCFNDKFEDKLSGIEFPLHPLKSQKHIK